MRHKDDAETAFLIALSFFSTLLTLKRSPL
jgi:hypothetical protein